MQYRAGLVTVHNGSNIVTGVNTAWLGKFSPGALFGLPSQKNVGPYKVVAVNNDGQIILDAPWGGDDAVNVQYWVTVDFTPIQGFPLPQPLDLDVTRVIEKALLMIDGLFEPQPFGLFAAKSQSIAVPPANPTDGDCYIVPKNDASGAWTGYGTKVAIYRRGAWLFYAPKNSMFLRVADEGAFYFYDEPSNEWILNPVLTSGSTVALREATPVDGGIPFWDAAHNIFSTDGSYTLASLQAALAGKQAHAGRLDDIVSTGITTAMFAANVVDADDTFAANSDTRISTQKAVKTYIAGQIAAIVASAPSTLDTLNELAAALGDDPNFATTTANALGNRVRVDAAQTLTSGQQAQARANIGAVIGTNVQAYDATLAAISGAGTTGTGAVVRANAPVFTGTPIFAGGERLRVEAAGAAPSGATGQGLEFYKGGIQAYDRTNSAPSPFAINASQLTYTNDATLLMNFTPTGLGLYNLAKASAPWGTQSFWFSDNAGSGSGLLLGSNYSATNPIGIIAANTNGPTSSLEFWSFQSGVDGWARRAIINANTLTLPNNNSVSWFDNAGTARRGVLLTSSNHFYFGLVDNDIAGNHLLFCANEKISGLVNGVERFSIDNAGSDRSVLTLTGSVPIVQFNNTGTGANTWQIRNSVSTPGDFGIYNPTTTFIPWTITPGNAFNIFCPTTIVYNSGTVDALCFIDSASGGKSWKIGSGTGALGVFGFYNATDGIVAGGILPTGRFQIGSLADFGVGGKIGALATSSAETALYGYNNSSGGAAVRARTDTSGSYAYAIDFQGNLIGGWYTSSIAHTIFYTYNADISFQSVGGGVVLGNNATAWSALSDYRIKKLYGKYAGAGDIVDAVPVYDGEYTLHGMPDGRRAMFLAHEVQERLPHTVDGEKDGQELQLLASTDPLVPILWSALQETRAELKELKARLAV